MSHTRCKLPALVMTVLLVCAVLSALPASSVFYPDRVIVNDVLIGSQLFPSAAMGPTGTIYVVYQDDAREGRIGEDFDIYLAKSTDGGYSWNPSILIYDDYPSTASQTQPALSVDSSGVLHFAFLAGQTNRLYYTRSVDGNAFTNPVRVDDAPIGQDSPKNVAQYPTIVVDDQTGFIYIGWRDHRNEVSKAYLSVSTDGGGSFSENRCIYGEPSDSLVQSTPSLVLDGSGTLFAAWHDNRDGSLSVYYSLSRDYGATFEFQGKIGGASGVDQMQPRLAVDSLGRIYAAYADRTSGTGNEAIAVASRPFNGVFEPPSLITPPNGCSAPAIAALDGGQVFVMHSEVIEVGQETYRGMFYLYSEDGGSSFSKTVQVDEKKLGIDNIWPTIVPAYDGVVTLVWEVNQEGDRNVISTQMSEQLPTIPVAEISPKKIVAAPGQTIKLEVRVTVDSVPNDSFVVDFSSDLGGSFSDVRSVGDGRYEVDYLVPTLPDDTKVAVQARAYHSGYPVIGDMARVIVSEITDTLTVGIVSPDSIVSGKTYTLTALVKGTSGELEGAYVRVVVSNGSVSPSGGYTDSNGRFQFYLTAPVVSAPIIITVHAEASADGYLSNYSVREIEVQATLALALSLSGNPIPAGEVAILTVRATSNSIPIPDVEIQTTTRFNTPIIPSCLFTDGNGEAKFEVAPEHAVPDNYSDIATAFGYKDGYVSSSSKINFTVLESALPPVPDFTYSIDGLTVSFDASSSYDEDGYIETYSWDFGDGNTTQVSGPFVNHTYGASGSYVVQLRLVDDDGHDSALSLDVSLSRWYVYLYCRDPIPSGKEITIKVMVSYDDTPLSGANVTLSTRVYKAEISPEWEITNTRGSASFRFYATAKEDRNVTFVINVTKEGLQPFETTRVVLLDVPDLHVYPLANKTELTAGESTNITIQVKHRLSVIPYPYLRLALDGGSVEPVRGYGDISGVFCAVFTAPLIEGDSAETITLYIWAMKDGYEDNMTETITFIVSPVGGTATSSYSSEPDAEASDGGELLSGPGSSPQGHIVMTVVYALGVILVTMLGVAARLSRNRIHRHRR